MNQVRISRCWFTATPLLRQVVRSNRNKFELCTTFGTVISPAYTLLLLTGTTVADKQRQPVLYLSSAEVILVIIFIFITDLTSLEQSKDFGASQLFICVLVGLFLSLKRQNFGVHRKKSLKIAE
jgi:hypothetical protein